MTGAHSSVARDFLDQVYQKLDFRSGILLEPGSAPNSRLQPDQWRRLGEWLILGERMGAENIFFVGDQPVIIFATVPGINEQRELLSAYKRAWSLARPQCLFVASDEGLRVYGLSTPPGTHPNDPTEPEPMEIVRSVADVSVALAEYHRDRVESGSLIHDDRFVRDSRRADRTLLDDVQTATTIMRDSGLPRRIAHGLIERIILVRYLEDRGVINADYFEEISNRRSPTQLGTAMVHVDREDSRWIGPESPFLECLRDHTLTYDVFEQLERDFNGDMFLVSPEERGAVTHDHLTLLYQLFSGEGIDAQESLFLWAYDFGVVPTSLISSMYEQFYHSETDDDTGTHYTPPELVEYVLSETLSRGVLDNRPSVCDPACGSGIFLVEAFRQIVRHEMGVRGEPLSPERLRSILVDQIAGIDTNTEAVRLAAFSLYLAYLNYQSPPEIRSAGKLPRLIEPDSNSSEAGRVLVNADAFSTHASVVRSDGKGSVPLPWETNSFDIVIGNPPWDEPRGKRTLADQWAKENNLPVGDRNLSQLFLWRALSLLKPGGTGAMLVAGSTFHSQRSTSKQFRREWMSNVRLKKVVNFTPARHVFFSSAVAPFYLVHFDASRPADAEDVQIDFQTVFPSPALVGSGSLAYAKASRNWVSQTSLRKRDYLWKTYTWGTHRDDALMARLDLEPRLAASLALDPKPRYGYQRGTEMPTSYLASLPSLKAFEIWGPLADSTFESAPTGVKRQPDERLYSGPRIVVARGVRAAFGPRARLEYEHFSFRHTIYCLPVAHLPDWQARTLLGTMLSSLGRYRIFMASGSWGVWHDSLVPEDILRLPVRMGAEEQETTRRIVDATVRLDTAEPVGDTLFSGEPLEDVLRDLDEAVFDLFRLTVAERDLVRDFATTTLDLANRRSRSSGFSEVQVPADKAGTVADVRKSSQGMSQYLEAFLNSWNRELDSPAEFHWHILDSPQSSVVAIVFEASASGRVASGPTDAEDWPTLVSTIGRNLDYPLNAALRNSGVVRTVTESSIIILKSREQRYWTVSAAREDAEATMLQAMILGES